MANFNSYLMHDCQRKGRAVWLLAGLLTLTGIQTASASAPIIPASERNVLLELYGSTAGADWTNHSGWLGVPGTECSWYGVSCISSSRCLPLLRSLQCPGHLSAIVLNFNNLDGVIQSVDLDALPYLSKFEVIGNNLYGVIPDFSLTAMQTFNVTNNFLSGSIPTLIWNTSLEDFEAGINFLSGPIPSLLGLSGLTTFDVNNNTLSGTIPALSGLSALATFNVHDNDLTGTIPALSGLSALATFDVHDNNLTGSLPSLFGLSQLSVFHAQVNRLSGSIPGFGYLPKLASFDVEDNGLTGNVPEIEHLSALVELKIRDNKLSGFVPNPPIFSALKPGMSTLCRNDLIPNPSSTWAWNEATGVTPWYSTCLPENQ